MALQLRLRQAKPSQSTMIEKFESLTDDESSCSEELYTSFGETKTKYEQLIEALPFDTEDAKIIIAGGQLGLLHETLALRAIDHCKSSPLLIYHDERKNEEGRQKYYHDAEPEDDKSEVIANLSAYIYWDYAWNYYRRQVTRNQSEISRLKTNSAPQDCLVWKWTPDVLKSHAQWCQKRELNPNSVRAISDLIDRTMNVLFETRFEPEWLRCTDPTPLWRRFGAWRGDMEHNHHDMLWRVYGHDAPLLCDTLRALCDSGGNVQAVMMQALEVVATKGDWKPCDVGLKPRPVDHIQQFMSRNKTLGKFVKWNSVTITRPSPKNFLQATREKGGNYVFKHDPDTLGVVETVDQHNKDKSSWSGFDAIAPTVPSLTLRGGALNWFIQKAEYLLLMGEGNFEFTEALCTLGFPPRVATTIEKTVPPHRTRRKILNRVFKEARPHRMTSLDATRVHRYDKILTRLEDREIRSFAWNFPSKGKQVSDSIHQDMILSTFSSLAALYDHAMDCEIPVLAGNACFLFAVTLNQDQFSKWFVLRSALRTGWRLRAWCPFALSLFPGYHPCYSDGEQMEVENARFYVFQYMYCNVL